jgi:hypothetical protein
MAPPQFPLPTKGGGEGGQDTAEASGRIHLTTLEDPDVRDVAARYGDPDQLLAEAWIPSVPGINAPGTYAEYGRDPARWVYAQPAGEVSPRAA